MSAYLGCVRGLVVFTGDERKWLDGLRYCRRWSGWFHTYYCPDAANGVQRINFASINAMLLVLLYLLTRVG